MKEEIVAVEKGVSSAKALSEVGPQSAAGANANGGAAAVLENVNARIGRYRWTICALLFFAATINYVDRQVIGILKPTLKTELGWDEIAYSNIVFWFQAAYALGLHTHGSPDGSLWHAQRFLVCSALLEFGGDGPLVG